MSRLAIKGGTPVRTELFPGYNTIGVEEEQAALRVLRSGVLSKYLGCWDGDFYGGREVRALEEEWARYFGVTHAMAVNSATSGLYAAVGACGLGPGDEMVVTPYTMSASATAALVYGAVPVFADIEPDCFCLDPAAVAACITERTKAIMVVDIFGLPYDAEGIAAVAEKHGLFVIEDCAQAPGATHHGRYAGTLGHIGVYSLNYHKHIHTGEGGVVVTDDPELAERVQLIRNHAEAVVGDKGVERLDNMIGFNFRMPEIEAALAREQLGKLGGLIAERQANAAYLSDQLGKLEGITPPKVREKSTHAYYAMSFRFDAEVVGVDRHTYIDAVRAELPASRLREAEGPLVAEGYVKPLYLQPLYQQRIAIGRGGFPFAGHPGALDYSAGLCPVTERLHYSELFSTELMRPGMTRQDLDDVVEAFVKVHSNLDELRDGRP